MEYHKEEEEKNDVTMLQKQFTQYAKHNFTVLPNIVAIEGNIGCGKSTLCASLKKKGFTVIPEPVDEKWDNYLKLLYKDPKKWSFLMQIEVFDWFQHIGQNQIKNHSKEEIVFVERSSLTGMSIFAENAFACGNLTALEYDLLQRQYKRNQLWQAKQVMYIHAPAQVCCDRIKERARGCEKQIQMEGMKIFVKQLHQRHEARFENTEMKQKQNVFKIDGSKSKEIVLEQALKIMSIIRLNQ